MLFNFSSILRILSACAKLSSLLSIESRLGFMYASISVSKSISISLSCARISSLLFITFSSSSDLLVVSRLSRIISISFFIVWISSSNSELSFRAIISSLLSNTFTKSSRVRVFSTLLSTEDKIFFIPVNSRSIFSSLEAFIVSSFKLISLNAFSYTRFDLISSFA